MLDNIFRLNPIFEIIPVEELTEKQRTGFRRILSGKNIHSLLHAPGKAEFSVKALNQPLAEFLENLREPQRVKDLLVKFREESDKEIRQLLIQLILDGVLEVESNGGYLSGIEALNKVISPAAHTAARDESRNKTFTHEISKRALEFTLLSVYKHPRDLAWILYNFNRLPMNRARRLRLPDEESVSRFLDLDEDGCWQGMSEQIQPIAAERDDEGNYKPFFQVWRSWRIGQKRKGKEAAGYKVYLCPMPEDVPAVFKLVRENVAGTGAHAMKTARVASALLRCDKLIVYFRSISEALEFVEGLRKGTSSFRGQGIPFSYQVNRESPMISIGVDPPGKFGIDNSWRRYVTDKLALAIQGCHREKADSPLEYIRTNMRIFGVDIDEWRPVNRDWTMEFDLDDE